MRGAFLVVGTALVVRAAFALPVLRDERAAVAPANDALEYLQLAENVVAGHGFSTKSEPPYTPEIFRVPLYPALLTVPTLLGQPVRGAVALNVLMGTLTALCVLLLAGRLFGERVGLVAGLLFALSLDSAVYGALALSETAFTLLVALAALAWFGFERRPLVRAVLAAVALSAATLTRAVGLVVAPLFLLHDVATRRFRALASVLVFSAVFCVPPALWMARNAARTGSFLLSTVPEVNLFAYDAPFTLSAATGVPFAVARDSLKRRLMGDAFDAATVANTPALAHRARALALEVIADHPLAYLSVFARGVARGVVAVPPELWQAILDPARLPGKDVTGGKFLRRLAALSPPMKAFWALWALQGLAYLLLAACGALGVRLRTAPLALVPLALVVAPGVVGYSRFRVPAVPFVCILAALALVKLVDRLRRGRSA